MDELLRTWGCEDLIQVFIDNDIDEKNFFLLTEDFIKELIPSVGKRMKFTSFFNSALEVNHSSKASTQTITSNETVNSVDVSDSNTNTLINTVIETNEDDEQIANPQITEDFILQPSFPDFDLRTLLSTTPLGLSVINYYKHYKCLDTTRRNRLTDIIVKHLFSYIVKNRLKHEQYNIITSKILTLFPNECSATYYVPAIKKQSSVTGRSILARGKLVDKCRNLIYKSYKEVPYRKRKNDSFTEHESPVPVTEQITQDINWLRFKSEPWSDVIDKWRNTYEVRRNSGVHTAQEFIDEWPILKDARSTTLVQLDFERLYPDALLKLISNWQTFFDNIYELKKVNIKDAYPQELLSLLDDGDLCEDSKFAVQLLIRPYLVPPRGRTSIGNSHWKFSTAECSDAIIYHAKIAGDVLPIIEKQKQKAVARKVAVQPYIIIEGQSLENIQSSYIVIDSIRYTCQSTRQAFDICFQIFHVFNLKYPPQAYHIYLLIQKGIYGIDTRYDQVIPYIMDIVEYMSRS